MVALLKKLLKAYYWVISPWLGNRCRFVPSCSEYSMQALDQHGAMKGLYLTGHRLCRCHPWGGEGYDPVPPVKNDTEKK
jgi:putative membrane protein insertion efficiency factor